MGSDDDPLSVFAPEPQRVTDARTGGPADVAMPPPSALTFDIEDAVHAFAPEQAALPPPRPRFGRLRGLLRSAAQLIRAGGGRIRLLAVGMLSSARHQTARTLSSIQHQTARTLWSARHQTARMLSSIRRQTAWTLSSARRQTARAAPRLRGAGRQSVGVLHQIAGALASGVRSLPRAATWIASRTAVVRSHLAARRLPATASATGRLVAAGAVLRGAVQGKLAVFVCGVAVGVLVGGVTWMWDNATAGVALPAAATDEPAYEPLAPDDNEAPADPGEALDDDPAPAASLVPVTRAVAAAEEERPRNVRRVAANTVRAPRQPAPRRASPPPATARGSLTVTSTPAGAQVFINSQPAGMTPLTLTGLPVGSRAVRVSLEGHEVWWRAIRIVAGQRTRLAATLEPAAP